MGTRSVSTRAIEREDCNMGTSRQYFLPASDQLDRPTYHTRQTILHSQATLLLFVPTRLFLPIASATHFAAWLCSSTSVFLYSSPAASAPSRRARPGSLSSLVITRKLPKTGSSGQKPIKQNTKNQSRRSLKGRVSSWCPRSFLPRKRFNVGSAFAKDLPRPLTQRSRESVG